MKQRGITVTVGVVIFAALAWLTFKVPVPYVQLEPGPSYNTLGQSPDGKDVIQLTGATPTKSAGQLRFLTIVIRRPLNLWEAVKGWIDGNEAVVPEELYFPPNQSQEQIDKQNAQDFATSISSAQTAALNKLGYPPVVGVKEVAAGSTADGKLKPGDLLISVDGVKIDTADTLVNHLRSKPAGSTFQFEITRDGQPMTVEVATKDDNGVPRIGVTPQITSAAPFKISIPIENVGGPSAGLMLTLGILDKIEPEDLTGGKIIAGTGSIDPSGKVGPIGGLPQKLVTAKDAHATWFLTPKDNCAEGVANQKPGLPLVQVSTLDDALAALADIRAGKEPPLCPGSKP